MKSLLTIASGLALAAAMITTSAQSQIVTVNQTGGVTAEHIDAVRISPCEVPDGCSSVPQFDSEGYILHAPVAFSPGCLLKKGAYVRNSKGRFDRTKWFISLSHAKKLKILSDCVVFTR